MVSHDQELGFDGPNDPSEQRTARICAFLLGELPPEELAQVEAELAANPEMQEEADLLAATIGLVRTELRSELEDEPALPVSALANLAEAAAKPQHAPQPAGRLVEGRFQPQTVTRIAAAALVLVGGVLMVVQSQVKTGSNSGQQDSLVALEVSHEAAARSSPRRAPESVLLPEGGSLAGNGHASSVDSPESATIPTDRANSARVDPQFLQFVPGTSSPPRSQQPELAGWNPEKPDLHTTTLARVDLAQGSGLPDLEAPKAVVDAPLAGNVVVKREDSRSADGGDGTPDPYPEVRQFLASAGRAQGAGAYRGPGDSLPPGYEPSGKDQDVLLSPPALPVSKVDVLEGLEPREQPGTKRGFAATASEPADPTAGFFLGRGEVIPSSSASQLKEFEQWLLQGYMEQSTPLNTPSLEASRRLREDWSASYARQLLELKKVKIELPGLRDRKDAEAYLRDCRPLPGEQPRDMYFRYWGDHPYVYSSQDAVATFAADVDTASYNLARRYLTEGKLPSKAQVRTEEFLNAFQPDVPAPHEGTFAVQTELTPSPFGGSEARWMLRVTVRGKEIAREVRDPLALTFVVDTSGSMEEGRRLELVKHALRLLVAQLDARDSIALVAFSNEARLVLPMTPVSQRAAIEAAIQPLRPSGGTNAEAGLTLGYELAASALTAGIHHRVVFLSDGVANIGQTDQDLISASVQHRREQGIYLNTIGVGMGNHNDVFLEQLADKGDGICDYVDDGAAVKRAIVDRFTGAFVPIASDVKIQVEFDPTQVLRWRQIGYENRAVADADFRNDAVDAGEVGAGHQVTALFEVERVGSIVTNSLPQHGLAKVRLRWKEPKGAGQDPREAQVFEVEHAMTPGSGLGAFASASPGYQRAVLVAQFAEVLRQSTNATGDSMEELVSQVQRVAVLPSLAGDKDTLEFAGMVQAAAVLGAGQPRELDALTRSVDEYKRHLYLTAQLRQTQATIDEEQEAQLKAANDALEQRIRELSKLQSPR